MHLSSQTVMSTVFQTNGVADFLSDESFNMRDGYDSLIGTSVLSTAKLKFILDDENNFDLESSSLVDLQNMLVKLRNCAVRADDVRNSITKIVSMCFKKVSDTLGVDPSTKFNGSRIEYLVSKITDFSDPQKKLYNWLLDLNAKMSQSDEKLFDFKSMFAEDLMLLSEMDVEAIVTS